MFTDSIFECTYWQCYVELPAKFSITFYNTYTKYFFHKRPAAHCMQHFCAEVNGTCKLLIFFILQNNACSIDFFFQVAQCMLALCREWKLSDNNICVIVSGRIKGAARVTNVMYPCGFICIPVVLTLRRMNIIKN